ncbi:MAG: hypothetical protein ALAOOOJD_02908 [bacterium]|nr:hypothetical protein [bacterium]
MKSRVVICFLGCLLGGTIPFEILFQRHVGGESRNYAQNVGNREKTTKSMLYSSHSFQTGGVQEAWVRHYGSGLATTFDQATAMALDSAGNVYVTGRNYNFTSGADYLTIKYDAAGKQIWTARYDGESHDDDFVAAIAVDRAGNVYVTGKSEGVGTAFDYVTIKYNNAGVQEWVVRYNGPENADDEAIALAVDSSGNIYVTGSSVGTNYDYATIKYTTTGLQEWIVRYNGPENLDERPVALAIADSGNICVTGSGQRSKVGPYDYVTIKYDMNGKEKWLARYTGPSDFDGNESAVDLAVDKSENVYVTGNGSGSDFSDYATVKYSRFGVQEWTARYSSGADDVVAALAVDDSGNVYVTGYHWLIASGTFSDYQTVKYNRAGVLQWVAGIFAAGSPDEPSAFAVDKSGNVYVTGKSAAFGTSSDYLTIKYNSRGQQQWLARYNAPANSSDAAVAIALDSLGNVYVTGTSRTVSAVGDDDYATIKYNNAGIQQWTAIYIGQENSQEAMVGGAVDADGNIYVAGWSYSAKSSRDYATIKYNPSGEQEWVARYNGPGNSIDQVSAVVLDHEGNVYVTGQSVGSSTGYDYATIKYNSQGLEQWVARYNSEMNASDVATVMAVDQIGNIYVTGSSQGGGYTTIKYNKTGVQQWVAHYYGSESPITIAVDASQNVYVLAKFELFIKYDSLGIEQWVKPYKFYSATALAVDNAGNVYLLGWNKLVDGGPEYVTAKYSSDGNEKWIVHYEDSANVGNIPTAFVVDDSGNVFVTGYSGLDYKGLDFVTMKYNSIGVQQWIAHYRVPKNLYNVPVALAVDKAGSVYVTGSSGAYYASATDYVTVKYDKHGTEQWVALFNGPRNSSDSPNGVFVSAMGDVYVTGTSSGDLGWSFYTTIKYAQNSVSVNDEKIGSLYKFYLLQNYPNPFNPSTKIRYAIPQPTHVSLKIFDLLGHEVATLVNETKSAGEYEIEWKPIDLSSGVYVYRLQAGGFVETQKLILLQ